MEVGQFVLSGTTVSIPELSKMVAKITVEGYFISVRRALIEQWEIAWRRNWVETMGFGLMRCLNNGIGVGELL